MSGHDLTSPEGLAVSLGELVRIPSVNPHHAGPRSGDGGERRIVDWLAERADALGAEVVVDHVTDGRCNVYATFAGSMDRIVVVDVHLDTVGVEHMTRDPFDGAVEGTRVYGRGAVDTKASLAVVLNVLGELRAAGQRPAPTVQVVGTVGEEMRGMIGAVRYRDWLLENTMTVDRLIVAEPTGCAPVHGHKGGTDLRVVVHGEAAHSAQVSAGVNAVSAAARVVNAIDDEHARLARSQWPTPVGAGSVATVAITGGLAPNIIPDRCEVAINRRTAPGEQVESVLEALRDLVVAAAHPATVEVEVLDGFAVDAFYREPDIELVTELSRLSGAPPAVAAFGSNAMFYGDVATDLVVFGPGSIEQAHKAEEWIEIDQLVRAAEIYRRLLTETDR
jgi:acetylornithine deacetylase/succinyl-diaminopimelate desuccinylase-like protein